MRPIGCVDLMVSRPRLSSSVHGLRNIAKMDGDVFTWMLQCVLIISNTKKSSLLEADYLFVVQNLIS
jgi:hypothetical protein